MCRCLADYLYGQFRRLCQGSVSSKSRQMAVADIQYRPQKCLDSVSLTKLYLLTGLVMLYARLQFLYFSLDMHIDYEHCDGELPNEGGPRPFLHVYQFLCG
jgi:hypothetical protein